MKNLDQWADYQNYVQEARQVYLSPFAAIWLPASWAFISGAAAGFICTSYWFAFDVTWISPVKAGLVTASITFGLTWPLTWLWWNRRAWAIESSLERQHYPANPAPTTFIVRENAGRTLKYHRFSATGDQLTTIATMIKNGVPLTVRSLKPLFGGSDNSAQTFQYELITASFAQWVSEDHHKAGIELTQPGRDYFFQILDTPPTPAPAPAKTPQNSPHTQDTR